MQKHAKKKKDESIRFFMFEGSEYSCKKRALLDRKHQLTKKSTDIGILWGNTL